MNEQDVIDMDQRMGAHDQNLNAKIGGDGDAEWGDMLADPADSHELVLAEQEDFQQKRALMMDAMDQLNEREREIILQRRLSEDAVTLEALSEQFGISRERVRQIETRALEKMTQFVMEAAAEKAKKALPAPKAA